MPRTKGSKNKPKENNKNIDEKISAVKAELDEMKKAMAEKGRQSFKRYCFRAFYSSRRKTMLLSSGFAPHRIRSLPTSFSSAGVKRK